MPALSERADAMKFRSNSLVSILGMFSAGARLTAAQIEINRGVEQVLIHNNTSSIEDTIADLGRAKPESQKGRVIALLSALQVDLRDKFSRIRDKDARFAILSHEQSIACGAFAKLFEKAEKMEEEKKKAKTEKEEKAKKTALETAKAEGWLSPEDRDALAVEWQAHPETLRLQRALDDALEDLARQAEIIKAHVQSTAAMREEIAALKAEALNLSELVSRIGECKTIKAVRELLAA
jgi:hypothetical protein